jgi:hypothetical protein
MNAETLWASLVWGAIGSGFAIYGKRQERMIPMIGGLVMIGASYVCETALLMSAVGVALTAGIWWLSKRNGS